MPDNKTLGELAQATFYLESLKRGLVPYNYAGDNMPFDFAVYSNDGKFHKTQVKSSRSKGTPHFTVGAGSVKRSYRVGEVDVVALYSFESGDWWLLPGSLVTSLTSLTPHSNGKYSTYKNNWSIYAPQLQS